MSDHKSKVLVIEDNREHLMALAIRLKIHGYDVVSAGDGVTAISTVKKELPDAILLDLGLPGGDGFVVLERLRSMSPTVATPVIVVTARPPETNKREAMKHGVAAFLQKPVRTEELLVALRQALQ
jgi:two-component system KDP operon response regulator KdpE